MKFSIKNIFLTMSGLATLGIIAYSFYISASVYSNVIIGRDEVNFIINSTLEILAAKNWHEWIYRLFQTHGQHVLAGMELGNLLSYYTVGSVNFQFINILGLLYLVIPCFLILYKSKPDIEKFIMLAAVVFPLALSPAHNTCAINAACTGNHYLGLGLSITALYFFTESGSIAKLALANLLMALAVFSSPASLPLTLLSFPIVWKTTRDRLSSIVLQLIFTSLILFIYYCTTHPIENVPFSFESWSQVFKTLLLILLTFFKITGSIFFWPDSLAGNIVCIVIGLLITTLGIITLDRKKTQAFYAYGFVMMLGMIALISLGRFYEFGSTRYVFYACFCLIFLLLNAFHEKPATYLKYRWVIVAFFLAYYPAQVILNKGYIARIKWQITVCENQWDQSHIACGVMIKHEEATQVLLNAQAKGLLPQRLTQTEQ